MQKELHICAKALKEATSHDGAAFANAASLLRPRWGLGSRRSRGRSRRSGGSCRLRAPSCTRNRLRSGSRGRRRRGDRVLLGGRRDKGWDDVGNVCRGDGGGSRRLGGVLTLEGGCFGGGGGVAIVYPGGEGTPTGLAPSGVMGDDGPCAAAITFARASSASCGQGLKGLVARLRGWSSVLLISARFPRRRRSYPRRCTSKRHTICRYNQLMWLPPR